jgi:hypothetical protein
VEAGLVEDPQRTPLCDPPGDSDPPHTCPATTPVSPR